MERMAVSTASNTKTKPAWVSVLLAALVLATTTTASIAVRADDSRRPAYDRSGEDEKKKPTVATIPYWTSSVMRLPNQVTVAVKGNRNQATMLIHLGNGQTIELDPITNIPANLAEREAGQVIEETRFVMEATARALLSGRVDSYALVRGASMELLSLDRSAPALSGVQPINIAYGLLGEMPNLANISGSPIAAGAPLNPAKLARLKAVFSFINDAMVLSTVHAARHHFSSEKKERVTEWGLQLGLRADLQFAFGRFNVTKNFPWVLHIGYNRDRREIGLRVSFRHELMHAGAAANVGVSLSVKRYVRYQTSGGVTPDSGPVQGRVWNPPNVLNVFGLFSSVAVGPVGAVLGMFNSVLDAAPGYRATGLSFTPTDAIPGTSTLNTVNQFSERDLRVFAIPIPTRDRVVDWISRVGASRRGFSSCQSLFLSAAP